MAMALLGRRDAAGRRHADASAADAGQAAALLAAANRGRAGLGPPSTLVDALIAAAASTVGVEAGSPTHRGLVDAAQLGYATRIGGAPVPDEARAAIEPHLVPAGDGRLGNRSITDVPEAVHALVRTATSLTASPSIMAAAAGVREGAWTSYCAAAASEVREDLLGSGLPDQPVLEPAFLESMIRLGVVLRIVDELAPEPLDATGA